MRQCFDQRIEKLIDTCISFAITAEQEQNLSKLAFAEGASFDSYLGYETRCLEDTRVDLLQRIDEWRLNSNQQGIFWLNGMAGTGKSTIACTAASAFAKQRCLGQAFTSRRAKVI